MKTWKYFLVAWLAVLAQVFAGCSSDDPIEEEPGIEQGGTTDNDGDGNEEGNGGEKEEEELTESLYQPFATNKFISKLVEEKVMYVNYQRQYSYNTYELSYDEKGRVKEYIHYILHKKGSKVTSQDTTIYYVTYAKNEIVTHAIFGPGYYNDDFITELNENGYDDKYSYNTEGYATGNSRDENGNIIKYLSSFKAYVYCTYTDYKNDTSIDLTSFLISQNGFIYIPSDVSGKRCPNLPETKKNTLGSPYGDFYNYTFDSKGRVTEIEVVNKSVYNGERIDKTYHLTYED